MTEPRQRNRRSLYVYPEIQFRFIAALILLVALESAFIGAGLTRLVRLAGDWQRPQLAWDFFLTLALVLVPLVIANVIIGLVWSKRFAGPVRAVEKGLKCLRDGDLSFFIEPRGQEGLSGLVQNFNETMRQMKILIHRDRQLVREAITRVERAEAAVHEIEVIKVLREARSSLSVVNAHFFKNGTER